MSAKHKLMYHLVLSTKYRKKALLGLEDETYTILDDIAEKYSFKIIESAIDNGDHLHLLIKLRPNRDVSSIVKLVKQVSTFKLYESHENELRKTYWGNKKILWSNGYFVETVGNNEKRLIDYIKNQA